MVFIILLYNFNRVHCTYFRGYGCIVVKNTTATRRNVSLSFMIFSLTFLLKDS